MTALYEKAPGWDAPAAGGCRPGMILLRDYLLERFGADNLGCYNNRAKTGGGSPSLHRDGRAIDIGFDGQLNVRDEAFAWLVDNADALGLQMVLSYVSGEFGGVRWRLPYFTGDTADGIGTWSKAGHWLHIERTNAGADDTTPIVDLVDDTAPAPAPIPTPPPTPPVNPRRLYTVNVSLPKLSTRYEPIDKHVKMAQAILNAKSGAGITVDGSFGDKTHAAVVAWQKWHRLEVDGIVGPNTWQSLIESV